jgi:hypothetical protein
MFKAFNLFRVFKVFNLFNLFKSVQFAPNQAAFLTFARAGGAAAPLIATFDYSNRSSTNFGRKAGPIRLPLLYVSPTLARKLNGFSPHPWQLLLRLPRRRPFSPEPHPA